MAVIIRRITSNVNYKFILPSPGMNNNQNANLTITANVVDLDLLSLTTEDCLWTLQPQLLTLVSQGVFTVTGTVDTSSFDYDGVSSLHADSNAEIRGDIKLASGTNVTLNQSGQTITVNSTGGGASLPIGAIVASSATPTGGTWLPCDGSTKSQSTYSTLYSQIGQQYMGYSVALGTPIALLNPLGLCWAGSNWFFVDVATGFGYTSTDGLTYAGTNQSFANTDRVSTDGNGTVFVYGFTTTTLYVSTNGGSTFTTATLPAASSWYISAKGDGHTWIGIDNSQSGNVIYSTNNGSSWSQTIAAISEVSAPTALWWTGSAWILLDNYPRVITTAVSTGSSGWTITATYFNSITFFSGTTEGAWNENSFIQLRPSTPADSSISIDGGASVKFYPQLSDFFTGVPIAASQPGTMRSLVSNTWVTAQDSHVIGTSTDAITWYSVPLTGSVYPYVFIAPFSTTPYSNVYSIDPTTGVFAAFATTSISVTTPIVFTPTPNLGTQFQLPLIDGNYIRVL